MFTKLLIKNTIVIQVGIGGFDMQTIRGALKGWNRVTSQMYNDCRAVGVNVRCLPVRYEQLVLHPRATLKQILAFLDLPWHESVMHHKELINLGNITLSK